MAEIITVVAGQATKDLINVKASTKEELRARAELLAQIYNDAVQSGDSSPAIEVYTNTYDPEKTKPGEGLIGVLVREYMEETVYEYTTIARDECFDALKATADPMLEAVKQLSYPTIRIVDKEVGEGKQKLPVTTIEAGEKQIDLLKLHKHCGGIGKDSNWLHMVEKFNFLLTAQKAVDLGIDPKVVNDSYAMSDIAKSYDLGKNPASKTNLLKTLQAVVTAMIGEEYKAVSHDVNFLLSVYSRKNRKALTVTCANHKYMRGYVMEICHRIVTGKSYAIEYKAVKGK